MAVAAKEESKGTRIKNSSGVYRWAWSSDVVFNQKQSSCFLSAYCRLANRDACSSRFQCLARFYVVLFNAIPMKSSPFTFNKRHVVSHVLRHMVLVNYTLP